MNMLENFLSKKYNILPLYALVLIMNGILILYNMNTLIDIVILMLLVILSNFLVYIIGISKGIMFTLTDLETIMKVFNRDK